MISKRRLYIVLFLSTFSFSYTYSQTTYLQEVFNNLFFADITVKDNEGKSRELIEMSSTLIIPDTTGVYGDRYEFQNLTLLPFALIVQKSWIISDTLNQQSPNSLTFYCSFFDQNDELVFRGELFTIDRMDLKKNSDISLSLSEKSIITSDNYWSINSIKYHEEPIEISKCIQSYRLQFSTDRNYHQEFIDNPNPCFDNNAIIHEAPYRIDDDPFLVQHSLPYPNGKWRIKNNSLYLLGTDNGVVTTFNILDLSEDKLTLSPSRGQVIFLSKNN